MRRQMSAKTSGPVAAWVANLSGPSVRSETSSQVLTEEDCVLVAVGQALREEGYRFITITPATHRRVFDRQPGKDIGLTDIFGWSRSFGKHDLPVGMFTNLQAAGALQSLGDRFRSRVRFSTLADQIFAHSSFPTDESDAVFFGPDTYRFARAVRDLFVKKEVRAMPRIADIGAGSGAGGLYAAALLDHLSPAVVLADINSQALRFSCINSAINGIPNVEVVASDLFESLHGSYDLIISNPPYLVDPNARVYRHGGGQLGAALSVRIVEQGIKHLSPGGQLLLYTGSAIVRGVDALHQALIDQTQNRDLHLCYEEMDPDVFGEELERPPYDAADRIAVIVATITAG